MKEIKIYDCNEKVILTAKAESVKDAVQKAVSTGADLRGAYLTGADLRGADLTGADLRGAYLTGADLRGAYLTGADLRGAYLTGAYLTGAYLRGAYLTGAYLRGAYLTGADLTGADLTGADLTGADLRGADLTGAKNINPLLTTPLMIVKDQIGKIRAYKLVNEKYEGPYYGGIKYEIGKRYDADGFDEDPFSQCGQGINLASLDWCLKEYQKGYHILLAEFTKHENEILIPVGTDGKFRVKWCRIIREMNPKELGLEE